MRFILSLAAMLAVGALAATGISELEPSPEGGKVVRDSQYQYLMTADHVGWDQFNQIHQSNEWQTPDVDTLNVVNEGALWIKVPLKPPAGSNEDWRLEVRWPQISRIDMAAWYSDQTLGEVHHAGKDVALAELEFAHKNIVFPVHLTLDNPTTLYLRIADREFIYLPMVLSSAEAYESYDTTRLVLFSMAFGILAVMILYNCSLYLAVRDRMYLFYTNAVFSSLLYLLAVSGYGRLVLWAGNNWLDAHASVVFAAYCFLSVAYFFRVFLDLPRYGGWVLKANTFFLLSFSAVLVGTITPHAAYAMAFLGPLAMSSTFVGFATAISVWRRGNASAKYFILAWTGVSVSTLYMILTLRGSIDYFPALEYSQTVAFVLEVVLLSLALADRIRRQRLAKEEAQASLLQMQEEANTKLEARVELRTRELESAMVDLKSANRELSNLTKIDPLTQVNNRRHFDETGKTEIVRAQRTGRPLSVVMVDIDHFKSINDTYGHVVGDKCLKLVAKCISQHVGRAADVVARYGGEEFALILPETEESDAFTLADRIRIAIEDLALIYDGNTIRMTASLGVCGRVPRQQETLNTLVNDADKALYQAKASGRNQVIMDAVGALSG